MLMQGSEDVKIPIKVEMPMVMVNINEHYNGHSNNEWQTIETEIYQEGWGIDYLAQGVEWRWCHVLRSGWHPEACLKSNSNDLNLRSDLHEGKEEEKISTKEVKPGHWQNNNMDTEY